MMLPATPSSMSSANSSLVQCKRLRISSMRVGLSRSLVIQSAQARPDRRRVLVTGLNQGTERMLIDLFIDEGLDRERY
jgi:hypothetical protein